MSPVVVLARELLDLWRLILWQLLPDASNDLVEKLGFYKHRYTPPLRFPSL
jgi:hypothetical protein